MSIILANWRSVVPGELSAWLREIVGLLAAGLLAIVLGAHPWVLIFFLWTYPWGRLGYRVIGVPMEIARQPFSFCLPGYRESLRKSCLLAALCAGVGFAPAGLVFWWILAHRDANLTAAGICLHLINGFLVGAAALLCIGLDFRFIVSRVTWGLVQLLSIPFFLVAVIVLPAFIEYAALGIPSAVAVCAVVWVCLGDVSGVVRGHRMILEDTLEGRAQLGVTRTVSPRVEGLFRRLMEQRRYLPAAGYIWGSLYRAFGLAFSYWIWMLLSIIGSALVLGYAPPWLVQAALVALGLVALAVHLPIAFDGVLLPLGRRELCYATLAVGGGVSLLLVGTAGLVAACTLVFSVFLSSSGDSAYASLAPRYIYLPCLLVPWVIAFRLFTGRSVEFVRTTIMFVLAFLLIAVGWWPYHPVSAWKVHLVFAGVLLSGWTSLLVTLWANCRAHGSISIR